jgi:hypothetical protein
MEREGAGVGRGDGGREGWVKREVVCQRFFGR